MTRTSPLLDRYEIDVVAYGPTMHEENSYFLIRAFKDLKERKAKEARFYNSDDWRSGPRDEVLSLIENYTTVVLPADETLIGLLKKSTKN